MATNSTITVRTSKSTRKSIYIHWDGYVEHNGKILFENFNNLRKVKRLVRGGSISVLKKQIKTKKPHSFEKPQKGVTIYYHRDRQEGWEHTQPQVLSNSDKVDYQEYNYYYDGEKWFVNGSCLEEVLKNKNLIL